MRILLLFILVIIACEPRSTTLSNDQLKGIWLGISVKADLEFEHPFSQAMIINDSSQVKYISGSFQDSFQRYEIGTDSIHFPYNSYSMTEIVFEDPVLEIGKFYPLKYVKIDLPPIEIDENEIADLFLGQWHSGEVIYEFDQEGYWEHDLQLGIRERFCWDIYDFEGYKFFQKKGSFKDCEQPYFSLGPILEISEDSLQLLTWEKNRLGRKIFRKVNIEKLNTKRKEFELCDPYLYENSRSDWHYFKYASFEGGLYELKKLYDSRYTRVLQGKNDGLVKIQFVINCAGEVGNFEVVEMNNQYQLSRLNNEIREQIVSILKDAEPWVPGERRGQIVDTFKYLIFKIEDGEIVEIFP